jgi:hypothetical protein
MMHHSRSIVDWYEYIFIVLIIPCQTVQVHSALPRQHSSIAFLASTEAGARITYNVIVFVMPGIIIF